MNSKTIRFLSLLILSFFISISALADDGGAEQELKDNEQEKDKSEKQSKELDPVIMATGNFEYKHSLLRTKGRGMDLELECTYRSGTMWRAPLGPNWGCNWDKYIVGRFQRVKAVPKFQPEPPCIPLVGNGGAIPGGNGNPLEFEFPGVICDPNPPSSSVSSRLSEEEPCPDERPEAPPAPFQAFLYDGGGTRIIEYDPPEEVQDPVGGSNLAYKTKDYHHVLIGQNTYDTIPPAVPSPEYKIPRKFILRQPNGTKEYYQVIDQHIVSRAKTTSNVWNQFCELYEIVERFYRLFKIEDRAGNTIHFGWGSAQSDGSRYVEKIIDTLGRTYLLNNELINSKRRLTSITDFDGRQVSLGYDFIPGTLTSITTPAVTGTSNGNDFPEGKTTSFMYDTGLAGSIYMTQIIAPEQEIDSEPFVTNTYYSDAPSKVAKQSYGGTNGSGIPAGGTGRLFYDVYDREDPSSGVPWGSTFVHRSLVIKPSGDVKVHVYDTSTDYEIAFFEFTGRLDPDAYEGANDYSLASAPTINSLVFLDHTGGCALNNPVEAKIRSSDPNCYVTKYSYTERGLVSSITFPGGNKEVRTYDQASTDVFQQANLLEVAQQDGSQNTISSMRYAYEPIFNQLWRTYQPRANDPNHTPPNNTNIIVPERYMFEYLYDYQEGDLQSFFGDEISRWGIDTTQSSMRTAFAAMGFTLPALPVNQGDLNADASQSKARGNMIKKIFPTVYQYNNPADPGAGISQTQEAAILKQYNRFSLVSKIIDQELDETQYEYFSEIDPDGDDQSTPPVTGLDPLDGTQGVDGGGFVMKVTYPEGVEESFNYDNLGRVTAKTDPRGFIYNTEYNQLDQVVSSTNPRGYSVSYKYNLNDKLTEKVISNWEPELDVQNGLPADPENENQSGDIVHNYIYDILDKLVRKEVQYASGEFLVTEYRYDRDQNQVLVKSPEAVDGDQASNVITSIFDERGILASATRGGYGPSFQGLITNGNVSDTIPTSPDTSTLSQEVDLNGNVTQVKDGLSHTTTFVYDGINRQISEIDAVGNTTNYTLDADGNVTVTEVNGEDGLGGMGVLLSRVYNLIDERGRTYQVDQELIVPTGFSGSDGPLTNGDGRVSSITEFDKKSRIVRVVDDNTHSAYRTYDGLDRVVTESDDIGNSRTYSYDKNSNVLRVTSIDQRPDLAAETYHTWNFYDELNRLVATVDNLGHTTRSLYDSRNNLVFQSDAKAKAPIDIELDDLPYSEEHDFSALMPPLANDHGNSMIYTYDLASRRTRSEQYMRQNGLGGESVLSGGDRTISINYAYDLNSRLTSQTDDNGKVTRYEYDDLNRRTLIEYADSTEKSFTYDAADRVKTKEDANNSTFTYSYDDIDRLTQTDISRGTGLTGTDEQTLKYDGLHRVVESSDNNDPLDSLDDEVVKYTYDSLGRVLREEANSTWAVDCEYDGVGNLLSTIYPDGRIIDHSYDQLNRTSEITEGTSVIAAYSYVGSRRFERKLNQHLPNPIILAYGYDGVRRPATHVQTRAGALLSGFEYGYDRAHMRVYELRQHENDHGRVWRYDSANRVIEELRDVDDPIAELSVPGSSNVGSYTGYTLDGANNFIMLDDNGTVWDHSSAINDVNEYSSFKGENQAHDNNGNRTTAGSKTYKYDALNRLVEAFDGQTLIASYTYDSINRRKTKSVSAGSNIRFIDKGSKMLEERDLANDSLIRQYVYGPLIDEPVQLKVFSGSVQEYNYLSDILGSVVGLVDDSGAVAEDITYDAYGVPDLTINTSATSNPLLYTSRYYDTETELYYYRNRYYDPVQGRFISRDPMGIWDDVINFGNGLAYVGSMPVTYIDPFGLFHQSSSDSKKNVEVTVQTTVIESKSDSTTINIGVTGNATITTGPIPSKSGSGGASLGYENTSSTTGTSITTTTVTNKGGASEQDVAQAKLETIRGNKLADDIERTNSQINETREKMDEQIQIMQEFEPSIFNRNADDFLKAQLEGRRLAEEQRQNLKKLASLMKRAGLLPPSHKLSFELTNGQKAAALTPHPSGHAAGGPKNTPAPCGGPKGPPCTGQESPPTPNSGGSKKCDGK